MAVYSKELISRAGERVAGALGVLLGALLMIWGLVPLLTPAAAVVLMVPKPAL